MKVLFIADPLIPVPPIGYGGIERIVGLLCEGFVRAGHEVALIAGEGSRNYGRLVTHRPPDNSSYVSRARTKIMFQYVSFYNSIGRDIVLNFGRIDYLYSLMRFSRQPIICCFQNPITESNILFPTTLRKCGLRLVGISKEHVRHVNISESLLSIIYNGVDTRRLHFFDIEKGNRQYLAFIGRFNRNKGADIAIDVATKASLPLRLAAPAPVTSEDTAYFEAEIKPHLRPGIEWIGEIGDNAKPEFLGSAIATLMPIRWDEPFGIVAAESLACGTPVIAMRRGALPEIIDDGRTGFLCEDVDGMVSAVGSVDQLSRTECRRDCEARFSKEVMVDKYLRLAESMIRNHR